MSFSVSQLNGFDIHRTTTVQNICIMVLFQVLRSLVVAVVVMRVWFFLLPLLTGKKLSHIYFWMLLLLLLTSNRAPSQRACNLTFAYCFGCYRKHSKHIQFARMSATYALLPYPSRINRTRIALYALFNRHNLRNDYNLKMTYQIFSS